LIYDHDLYEYEGNATPRRARRHRHSWPIRIGFLLLFATLGTPDETGHGHHSPPAPWLESDSAPKELDDYSEKEKLYNGALIVDEGYVDGKVLRHGFHEIARVDLDHLTWKGHDFLDASRDDTIWKKAREKFMKPAVSWTLPLLMEWLKAEAKAKIMGDTGG
jgi:hypothetical protein